MMTDIPLEVAREMRRLAVEKEEAEAQEFIRKNVVIVYIHEIDGTLSRHDSRDRGKTFHSMNVPAWYHLHSDLLGTRGDPDQYGDYDRDYGEEDFFEDMESAPGHYRATFARIDASAL